MFVYITCEGVFIEVLTFVIPTTMSKIPLEVITYRLHLRLNRSLNIWYSTLASSKSISGRKIIGDKDHRWWIFVGWGQVNLSPLVLGFASQQRRSVVFVLRSLSSWFGDVTCVTSHLSFRSTKSSLQDIPRSGALTKKTIKFKTKYRGLRLSHEIVVPNFCELSIAQLVGFSMVEPVHLSSSFDLT